MAQTILITGSTDGIGYAAAKDLVLQGHNIILHGRNADKLDRVQQEFESLDGGGNLTGVVADLSRLSDVQAMAETLKSSKDHLDALINNAGVFKTGAPLTADGLDVRFVVNVLAPALLARELLPIIPKAGRVINLSSAAQAPVDLDALVGEIRLSDNAAYAQSKLALTMWNRHMAVAHPYGPAFIAVNPASFIGTNMVKAAYGMDGKDVSIGSDILVRSALDPEFSDHSGDYFDNDLGIFGRPHPDATDAAKIAPLVETINALIAKLLN